MIDSSIKRGLRNVSYLALGQIIVEIIGFFGVIYFARTLGPYNYGIYTTVTAFVGLFTSLSLSGMIVVLVRESSKKLEDTSRILENAIGIKNFFAVISILVCIASLILTNYEFQLKLFIILFSSTLFIDSTNNYFTIIFKSYERMEFISILSMGNSILFTTLALIFLYLGFGVFYLLILNIFCSFVFLLIRYKISRKFVIFKFWKKIKFDRVILKPSIIFSLQSFFIILTTRVDYVMISFLGSIEDVGIYSLPYSLAMQGGVLINIISTAFFPMLVKRFNQGPIKAKILFRYSFILGISVFVLSIVGYLFVDEIIILLFGNKYLESIPIMQVLLFYIAFLFFQFPFLTAANATGNENLALKIQILGAIMNIVLNYVLFIYFGLIGIAYSTVVVFSTICVASIFFYYRKMKGQGYII